VPSQALACEHADAQPGATSADVLRDATLCLLNEQRARHNLPALRLQAALTKASTAHAQDMVAGGYFAHESPTGGTLVDRLKAAAWLPRGGGWMAGENIAWGSGALATPQAIADSWMQSPGHRDNILRATVTQIGIGIVGGAPAHTEMSSLTYVADFGSRSGDESTLLSDYVSGWPRCGSCHRPPSRTRPRPSPRPRPSAVAAALGS
jgi:uncharacterized protein YkwD